MMGKAKNYYSDNIKKCNEELEQLNKVINIVGWLRLLVVIVIIALAYYLYRKFGIFYSILSIVLGTAVFMAMASYHNKKITKRDKILIEIEFNEKGLKRINGEYKEFKDIGDDLIDENHPFGNDIDIFGKNSLFQMINTTRTKSGREKLGKILSLNKLPTKEEIIKRQEAVKELGQKVDWRKKLYVNATFKKKKSGELKELLEWCNSESKNAMPKVVVACFFILITLIMIFLCISGVFPISYLILDLMVNFVIIKFLTRDKNEAIYLFQEAKYDVKAYSNILIAIEDEEFKCEYLKNCKKKLNNEEGNSCKEAMKKLSNLLDWIGDSAGNAYFFIFNVLLFADVFILYNLNNWKNNFGDKLPKWLDVMGEFEAVSSISNLSFDNDEWNFAEISDVSEVKALCMAHPLIGERAVANSYDLEYPKKITLITGSNMSGKSTFLRTVGVNLVLAYIGAPSRAKKFKCSIMDIYTCMRTKDNLEESISSFYAEILRIKLIIEACRSGKRVFFLLDEIFKGTNSRDRHIGATVLIKQLAENGAIGLLSTHDLELCDLEKEMDEIQNYNFREYYEDNKIKFDYKLRKGRSTTQNAVYLMKLAGIEIND